MDFTTLLIEELIEARRKARVAKDWKSSDELRNYLDTKRVFIFDTKDGQEIHYLPESYFRLKVKTENSVKVKTFTEWFNDTSRVTMTERQYLELQIKNDIDADKNFDAWLFSTKKSIKAKKV
jgi:hypothetical protein